MRTIITSALFIAQLMSHTVQAQDFGSSATASNPVLADRISTGIREELGLAGDSSIRVSCSITARHESGSGTGAALVMYGPARIHLSVGITVLNGTTGQALWSGAVHATGRTTMDQALEDAVERGAQQIAKVFSSHQPYAPVNVIASQDR